jgi:hypothetical protein
LKGDLKHFELDFQILVASLVTTNTTFNLAHWVFAFSYLALSYRLELIAKGLPENTHNSGLNTANAVVGLFIVAGQVIYWTYALKGKQKIASIAFDIG